jgi:endo-1,3(4)-beta-glucanase
MMIKLMPEMQNDEAFVDFIEVFIRDNGNPSRSDPYFPQFRAFDWFDMHSWSRGLARNPNGKDQESTSEEVNFHYGLTLWGMVTRNEKVAKLGATLLVCASRALEEYFLMKRDNRNHPKGFAINHVTGIFFQNNVAITTWFGPKTEYIHGIQMLPLSAGLLLSRKPDFCFEEWGDSLAQIPIDHKDKWWTILLTGNLAFHNPEEAWKNLMLQAPEYEGDTITNMWDDGLTKAWGLYWTSVQNGADPDEMPTPAPTPVYDPGGPGSIFCAPNTDPPQMCPGDIECPLCGLSACACPGT